MRAQSAIEYLWAYVWTFIVLAVVISAIVINASNKTSTGTGNAQASCYINPEIVCQEAALLSNHTSSKAVVVFVNGLGVRIDLPSNTFRFTPSDTNHNQYLGGCVPGSLQAGATAVCNATISNLTMPIGSEVEPSFSISYSVCQNGSCNGQVYNAVGSGTVFVSQYTNANVYTLGRGVK